MKNILLFTICLLGMFFPAAAQQTDGKKILDSMSDAFQKAGGIQAEFTIQVYSKGQMDGVSVGTIRLKGEKFRLDADGVKTWFDGKTQWSYIASNDEVNVSEPTQQELQSINPYMLLGIYKSGYHISLGKATTYVGKPVFEVILNALDMTKELQQVTLYITKDKYQPLGINVTQLGGINVTIGVKSYKTGQAYDDKLFVFDKKAYPSSEVIDLR